MDHNTNDTRAIVEAWHQIRSKFGSTIIPDCQNGSISDNDLIAILTTIRARIAYVQAHPDEEDPCETNSALVQDFYWKLQSIADSRGIAIDDIPVEQRGK